MIEEGGGGKREIEREGKGERDLLAALVLIITV